MSAAPDALNALLARQRDCLRGGRMRDLAALLPEMERLIALAGAGSQPQDRAALLLAREAAARNAVLLRAALSGIAAARRRVAAIRSAAAGRFATYDQRGQSGSLAGGRPDVERRA